MTSNSSHSALESILTKVHRAFRHMAKLIFICSSYSENCNFIIQLILPQFKKKRPPSNNQLRGLVCVLIVFQLAPKSRQKNAQRCIKHQSEHEPKAKGAVINKREWCKIQRPTTLPIREAFRSGFRTRLEQGGIDLEEGWYGKENYQHDGCEIPGNDQDSHENIWEHHHA